MCVVRIRYLSGWHTRLERLASDRDSNVVAETAGVKVGTVVQTTLLPADWSGLASDASATVAAACKSTANFAH